MSPLRRVLRAWAIVGSVFVVVLGARAGDAHAQERPAPGSQVMMLAPSGPTPDAVPFDAHASAPDGTSVEPRWAVFGAGVAVFGVSYLSMLIGALTAGSASPPQHGLELAAIPIVGPFVVLDGRETAFAVGLVLDAVGQIAGLAMMIAGLADGERVVPRAGDVSLRGGRLTLTF
jgi:hypothetical protein